MNKHQLARVVQAIERQGWRLLRITGRQHYLFVSPTGAQLTVNLHGAYQRDRYVKRHLRRDSRRLARAA